MKMLILLLFVSLNVMAKDTIISKERKKRLRESQELRDYKASGDIKVEKIGLLWNSVGKDLNNQIYCNFVRNTKKGTATLNYCYSNNIFNFATFSATANFPGFGKYKVISRAKISYNAHTCDLLMGEEVIGKYYGGHCFNLYERSDGTVLKGYDGGIKVLNASIMIDEINKEIIID